MAETILNSHLNGFSEGGEAAENAIVKMQKNLSWLLTHLDSRNVQSLNTNLTQIQSGDGATTLDGAQIIMRDASGAVRAVLGKSASGKFVFAIYSEDGTPAIRMDDDGNAVFSGNVESADITGSNIRIAPNTFNDYIALENDGTEDSISLYYGGTRIGGIRMLDAGGMEIFGSKISIGSSSGTVSIAPGASGTFTADGKTVTVKKGVITSIA
ncbi:MAG: hypothetical protein IJN25_06995 [Clostridia bacterium]|nr:hypothetical protein [Oscillospiraceae bacterium]MBQ7033385.1 hypothetical protein [Clostridia bacterium]